MRVVVLIAVLATMGTLTATPVKVSCCIVRTDEGESSWTATRVVGLLAEVNQIYRQAAMRFVMEDIVLTNDTYLSQVVYSDPVQRMAVCGILQETGGIEIYFVTSLDGGAVAFNTSYGIVVGPGANARTIAHEIGHACGLRDIYVSRRNVDLVVEGCPRRERVPYDWGRYPDGLKQADLVRRLLMFGVRSDVKEDIPYGDVYGLWYSLASNASRKYHLSLAPVGFVIHGNRHPVHR